MPSVTGLLNAIRQGDHDAFDTLLPLVYAELRRIARGQIARDRPGQTLSPTGLVHEAYIKLARGARLSAENRAHFLAIAANAMRQILVEHARARHAAKRGGAREQVTLDERLAAADPRPVDLLDLDAALERLGSIDPDQSRLVEMRYFGGLSNEEIADALGISVATVKRRWNVARAFLHRELHPS